MKKVILGICITALAAFALAGCASGGSAATSVSADASASAEPSASTSEGTDTASEAGTASSEGQAGMANPWSSAASAQEAADGAGVGSFSTPVGTETSLGIMDESWAEYSYMEGLAECHCPVAAVEMFIRKGLADIANEGDVSGDYNAYAHTWTTDINGITVTCWGNRDQEATKTIWADGDYCYSLLAIGGGGDSDFGLSPEDLAAFVSAIK